MYVCTVRVRTEKMERCASAARARELPMHIARPRVLVRVQSEQRCGTARPSGILPFHACMLNSESEISDSEIICIDMPGYPRGKHYFQ